jgi:hypothetical protein
MSNLDTPAASKSKPNLLSSYYRQPKIFIKLPSEGKFYPQAALDSSATGEYAVYAMTAKDELMLKTPDALLNGQATVELIRSCIPAIKDPWKMPTIDVDAALMAIRVATHGEKMEVSAGCPSCNHANEYEFNIVEYLNRLQSFNFETKIECDPLVINIRPYTYQEGTKAALKSIEQQRIFAVVSNDDMPDAEKIERFGSSFLRLTELTVDVVCGCISSIETPDGIVDDAAQIKEFIDNTTSEIFNKINDRIVDMKNKLDLKEQHVSCGECKHEYDISITMDQSNFFAVRS